MQDFAKTKLVVDQKLTQSEGGWRIDAGSVLIGILLSAIVVFAGLKVSEHREIQPSNDEIVETTVIVESGIDFEFYEILKRGRFLQQSGKN